jgi:hypothetical protein
LPIAAADAATVTDSFSFTASGFTPSGSPVDPWTGSFTITFDPTDGNQAGALAFSSNLPASYGTFTFVYIPTTTRVLIGDTDPCCSLAGGMDNALLFLPVTASGHLTFGDAALTSTSSTSEFFTTSGTLTPTPLPATLPLFATGLGALGLLGWRRKRKARVSLLGEA